MNKHQRLDSGNRLKAAFNLLWDKSLEVNKCAGQKDVVSYRDITRIADMIRSEGSSILGLDGLPKQIDSGLNFACAALDPNKARAKETLKQGIGGLSGAGGLALAWVCLGQLMNPGLWATVVAFFIGGIPGGPMPVVGIAAGLFIAIGAVWAAFQKMSPEEKATKAHEYVMRGIDNWVEYGSSDKPVTVEEIKQTLSTSATRYGFSIEDLSACIILLMSVSDADGFFHEAEKEIVNLLSQELKPKIQLNLEDAVQAIKRLSLEKRQQVVDWCFQVALADGIFHAKEVETLRHYCQTFSIDFERQAQKYDL